MYLLMYLLDLHHFWIFKFVLKQIINKIYKLMCSVFFVGNKSCDNKTMNFGVFDQFLLSFQELDGFS